MNVRRIARKPSVLAAVTKAPRDVPLEALRGIAALAVVVWHFFLGLDPAVLSNPAYGLRGTPFFAFVNGGAAVSVFFVLSGYVLTHHYFKMGQKKILIAGALKRWFRLFVPVFLSVMLSWLLFHFDLYNYEKASAISHSDWLSSFGFAMQPPFKPTFIAALQNSFGEIFYHNSNAFNPLLWTIHIEFIGSLIAFAFAALVKRLRKRGDLIAFSLVIGLLIFHFIESYLSGFFAGTLLAFYASRPKNLKHSTGLTFLAIGIVFMGYHEPVGFYRFLAFIDPINDEILRSYIATIGAIFIMISFIGYQPLRHLLQGRAARYLGRMSFSVYLVHLILIFSLGSTVFTYSYNGDNYGEALLLTAIVLIPAIAAMAGLFAVIDIKWVAFVNSVFRQIKIAG